MKSGPLAIFYQLLGCSLLVLLSACSNDHLASNNTALSNLYLENVALDQVFQTDQTDYTASVGYLDASVNLYLDKVDSGAAITVNGSAYAAGMKLSLAEGANPINIVVTAADVKTTRTYTLDITRQSSASFAQAAYVKSLNTQNSDFFGSSVAIDGNLMAIGAIGEDSNSTGVNSFENDDGNADDSGAIYIFVRDSSGVWYPEAYLKPDVVTTQDYFGTSVALSGNILAVGSLLEDTSASDSGAVYIFVRDAEGNWSQETRLKSSNPGIGDLFGNDIALYGNTLAVGAINEDSITSGIDTSPNDTSSNYDSGAVYVFVRDNQGNWSQQAYIKASNAGAGDKFGRVALYGDTLAVGAKKEDSTTQGINTTPNDTSASYDSGAVYVFERNPVDETWSQTAYLKASNAGASDLFGGVALFNNTLAVSASLEDSNTTGVNSIPNNDGNADNSGAVYIFDKDASGNWSQTAYIKAFSTGTTHALDGFGGPAATNSSLGGALALYQDTLVVAAYHEDSSSTGIDSIANELAGDSGAAYVYTRDSNNNWTAERYIKPFNTTAGDFFGNAISLSGDSLIVGSFNESSNSLGIDGPDNEFASGSGAAYLFR